MSDLLAFWDRKEDSIFYFFLLVSAVVFIAAETQQLYRYFKTRATRLLVAKPRPLDPKSPIGWAIVPALFIFMLAFVQWEKAKSPSRTAMLETTSPSLLTLRRTVGTTTVDEKSASQESKVEPISPAPKPVPPVPPKGGT